MSLGTSLRRLGLPRKQAFGLAKSALIDREKLASRLPLRLRIRYGCTVPLAISEALSDVSQAEIRAGSQYLCL